MAYFTENCSMYLNDCLNFPIYNKCTELSKLIDFGSIKDLQDFFPTLVKSIFGSPGWGLRTISREMNPLEFEHLYNFFIPLGPMIRLCYRMLNEPIKFDVPMDLLPAKAVQMLHSGRYSVFYSDILNIDPYRRQVTSLQLNAFDYFIFHFVVYGMAPLHKMHPGALAVHNDHLKTAYFYLTADYLCSFLPSDPDTTVMPANVFCSVKLASAMPIQPIQPAKAPKYLSTSALSHNFTANTTNIRTPESSRSSCWRTETVLHLFIDTWLRYDIDENPDLPSSEFIRVVRILVKQLHSFGNSAELDNTSMAALRGLAQPMMNAQMYTFLRSVIQRWPLDSSFSVVLELWLSYVQPWRYTYNKQIGLDNQQVQPYVPRKYEAFIAENLISYTQIFIHLLPRFERLDLTSLKNVSMIFRLAKVFGQSNLNELLKHNEVVLFSQRSISPIKSTSFNTSHNTSGSSTLNRSFDINDWNSSAASLPNLSRSDNYLFDDNYICLFGPEVVSKIENLVAKMFISREDAITLINHLELDKRKRYKGFFGLIKWYLLDEEDTEVAHVLIDTKKIPETLDFVIQSLANIFEIELPDAETVQNEYQQYSWDDSVGNSPHYSTALNDSLESNLYPSPVVMRRRIKDVKYSGDPALLPIQSNELSFLVRILYRISSYLNDTYSEDLQDYWNRNDFIGKLTHRVLEPPVNVRVFEKTHGISRLHEKHLAARFNLRWIASYRTIIFVFISLVFGHLFYGVPVFGFFMLIIFKFIWIFLFAAYDLLVSN